MCLSITVHIIRYPPSSQHQQVMLDTDGNNFTNTSTANCQLDLIDPTKRVDPNTGTNHAS